jgi:hypothetical protein
MDAADDVARAARNLITAHGTVAETVALVRAKHAEESNRKEAARTWLGIATAVSRLQGRMGR